MHSRSKHRAKCSMTQHTSQSLARFRFSVGTDLLDLGNSSSLFGNHKGPIVVVEVVSTLQEEEDEMLSARREALELSNICTSRQRGVQASASSFQPTGKYSTSPQIVQSSKGRFPMC